MRSSPRPARLLCAALLALLLALRLLTPDGFMPAFDRGAVTIVACPDAEPAMADMAGMAGHHDGDHKAAHQPCPYAAASGLGALGGEWMPLLALLVFAIPLLLGRTFLFVERHARRDRPPAIGPPIPA